ncbi:MAG: hypothetical protein SGBAC_007795 [Bacillariaceae sp.]
MHTLLEITLFILSALATVSAQPWTVSQVLKPSDGESVDNFGRSVAIESSTIAIGAPLDDINGTSNQGSVYIFENNGTGWVETAKVTPQLDETKYFGYSVVIQGDMLVAGARFDNVNEAYGNGEAYVFKRNATTGNWTEVQRLSEPLPQVNAHFGDGMAIDDRTLLIGEPGTNNYEGAVHVFIRPDEEWIRQTVLYPPRTFGAQEEFGTAVDVAGDWAVVGAKHVEEREELPGYAMIFYRNEEGVWDEGFVIRPDESVPDDEFGRSVTIRGDTVVVARKDDSFVFQRTRTEADVNEWTQTQKLDSGKAVQLGGDGLLLTSDFVYSQDTTNGSFVQMEQEQLKAGGSWSRVHNVAISGNTVLIGEPSYDSTGIVTVASTTVLPDGTLAPVSAPFSLSPTTMPVVAPPTALATNRPTLFLRPASQWISFQEVNASDGMPDDKLGYGVAIDGTTLVAGAYSHIVNDTTAGAAYVFDLVDGSWQETQKLFSDDPDDSDYFARAVAIHGNQIAVGARFEDNGRGDFGSGRVYVFLKDETSGNWSQTQMLEDIYGETNAHYGDSVALNDNFLLVGEPGVRAAHVYSRAGNGIWNLSASFLPDRPALEEFGVAVALGEKMVVVGAPSEYPHYRPGFVMIYTYAKQDGWSSGFKLQSTDSVEKDYFGSSVALQGTTLAVAARRETYIFELADPNDDTSWTQVQKIDEDGPLAMDGNYLMIGRLMYNKLADGVWRRQQTGELLPTQGSNYIYAVDVSENFAVLGHPFSNDEAGLVSIYQNRFFVQPTEQPSLIPSDQPSLIPTSMPTSKPTLLVVPFTTEPVKTQAPFAEAPSSDRGINIADDPSSASSLSFLFSYCIATVLVLPMLM